MSYLSTNIKLHLKLSYHLSLHLLRQHFQYLLYFSRSAKLSSCISYLHFWKKLCPAFTITDNFIFQSLNLILLGLDSLGERPEQNKEGEEGRKMGREGRTNGINSSMLLLQVQWCGCENAKWRWGGMSCYDWWLTGDNSWISKLFNDLIHEA